MFLDTVVYKGTWFNKKIILDVKTTETFQHTFRPLSPTDLSKEFEESVWSFKRKLDGQRLPTQFERKIAIRNKWNSKKLKSALLKQNSEEEKEMLPFVTQYQPLASTLKEALMEKWNLKQNQPLLCKFFKNRLLFPTRKESRHGKENAC